MIQKESFIALRIDDFHIYEYIYHIKKDELYICINKQDNSDIKTILNDIIDHDLLDTSSLYVRHTAFELSEFNNDYQLPVIYIHHGYDKLDFVNALASKVKGLAYVIYGDISFENYMNEHYFTHNKHTILLFNNERLSLRKFSKENYDQFIERIYHKIHNYMIKYDFGYPYSFDQLYQHELKQMIEETKVEEEHMAYHMEEELLSLEIEKEDYEQKIEELQQDILLLKSQIEMYESQVHSCDLFPLIYKGDIKEFYEDEQKEMLLHLIQKRLETATDEKTRELLLSIIEDNPSSYIREKKLNEFKRALTSSRKLNQRIIEDLRQNGLILSRHTMTHYFFNFYDDPRYSIDIASSPSDMHWGRQSYRRIKKGCF